MYCSGSPYFKYSPSLCPTSYGNAGSGTLSGTSGTLTYPPTLSSYYTGNRNYCWRILCEGGTVLINFTFLSTEPDHDFVYFYESDGTTWFISGSAAGAPHTATVPGDVVIRFVSDPYVNGQGFSLDWTCSWTPGCNHFFVPSTACAVGNPSPSVCPASYGAAKSCGIISLQNAGRIRMPCNPQWSLYPDNDVKCWRVPNCGGTLHLTWGVLETEATHDYVRLYYTSTQYHGPYSGDWPSSLTKPTIPDVVDSDVVVYWESDFNTASRGWRLDYTCVPRPTQSPTAPTGWPTSPTGYPTEFPTPSPTSPTQGPTSSPTRVPSIPPTQSPLLPTTSPSYSPSDYPSTAPTTAPTRSPTVNPTPGPSRRPSQSPLGPTIAPTDSPSQAPTVRPTLSPLAPSHSPVPPTSPPSNGPSEGPSSAPTRTPSQSPLGPTFGPLTPSANPSPAPTVGPTRHPLGPSLSPVPPTSPPSKIPSGGPSPAPTRPPSQSPRGPTPGPLVPTGNPSRAPTTHPTRHPLGPSLSPVPPTSPPSTGPSESPSQVPTVPPSRSPLGPTSSPVPPTSSPSGTPTTSPTAQPRGPTTSPDDPTQHPTQDPSHSPTQGPTTPPTISPVGPTHGPILPTPSPSQLPSSTPSRSPSSAPSASPLGPTAGPIVPTDAPTESPTSSPSRNPSASPSPAPSGSPTAGPSPIPSAPPTRSPLIPTPGPTTAPTVDPSTARPTTAPSTSPTMLPSQSPTRRPTLASAPPSASPTRGPSTDPSVSPLSPTGAPSASPSTAPSPATVAPTQPPTLSPSSPPVVRPSARPSWGPSTRPAFPTTAPSTSPSEPPSTPVPSGPPSGAPRSAAPSARPSAAPLNSSSAPSVSPTLPPAQPPPAPEVVQPGQAVDGVVAGVSAVTASGAAAGPLVMAMDTTCSDGGASQNLSVVLHPTGLNVADSEFFGCLCGNLIIIVGVTVLSFAVLYLMRSIDLDGNGFFDWEDIENCFMRNFPAPVKRKIEGIDIAAVIRHPDAILGATLFLYQGTSFAALRLLLAPRLTSGAAGPVWMHIFGALFALALLALPLVLYRFVERGVSPYPRDDYPELGSRPRARIRPWDPPAPPRWLQYALLSEAGDWVSCHKQKHWVNRWSSAVRKYRAELAATGCAADLIAMWALGLANSIPTPTWAACGHVRATSAGIHFVQLVYTCWMRPYRSIRENVARAALLAALMASLMSVAVEFYRISGEYDGLSTEELHHKPSPVVNAPAGSALLFVALAVVLVQVAVRGLAALVLLLKGWRGRIQLNEWAEFEKRRTALSSPTVDVDAKPLVQLFAVGSDDHTGSSLDGSIDCSVLLPPTAGSRGRTLSSAWHAFSPGAGVAGNKSGRLTSSSVDCSPRRVTTSGRGRRIPGPAARSATLMTLPEPAPSPRLGHSQSNSPPGAHSWGRSGIGRGLRSPTQFFTGGDMAGSLQRAASRISGPAVRLASTVGRPGAPQRRRTMARGASSSVGPELVLGVVAAQAAAGGDTALERLGTSGTDALSPIDSIGSAASPKPRRLRPAPRRQTVSARRGRSPLTPQRNASSPAFDVPVTPPVSQAAEDDTSF
eukprot:TRINITY_DN19447_c0_g1_i3.p1 TRINITY_DN19447_c0_g1~~TRINITY_DN19447_c0_g1_i3.p1  ORF type:complete len:1575 (+),score=114.96 TRINITY_DN19447_c0_g1_i3:144-4868(+)